MLYSDDVERLVVGWNVASNGRPFCLMIFALCLVAFAMGFGPAFARLAVLPVACVGLSCIVDGLPASIFRTAMSLAVYALGVVAAVLFLVMIG